MRNFFSFLFVSFVASGCYLSHERPSFVAPMEDAGSDAGPIIVADTGVVLPVDAGQDFGPEFVDAAVEPALTVSLSANTPPAMTLARNATGAVFLVFDLTVGALPVTLMGLDIHRFGVGAATDFSNVYLFDNVDGARLTTGRTINTVTNNSTFHPMYRGLEFISLPAHSVTSFALAGDLQNAFPGNQHGFEITGVDAVTTAEGVPVSGSFPVRSNVFSIGTVSAPRLDVRRGTILPDVRVGDVGAEVANFTLETSSDVIYAQRIWLLHAGSASPDDLTPSAAIVDADHNPIVWLPTWWNEGSLDNFLVIQGPDPFGVSVSGTVSISVFMNISGPSERSIKFYVEYPTDINAVTNPAVSWSPAAVCISNMVFGGCSAPDQGHYDGSDTRSSDPAFSEVYITR